MDHPIDVAARLVGSQKALADYLGVTKAAVGQWKEPRRRIPSEHCPDIELITKGAVRCEDMRPDVKWWVLRSHQVANDAVQTPPMAEQHV